MSNTTDFRSPSSGERGSAMVFAMFVLFLLSVTGVSLLFLGTTEAKMGRQSTKEKQAFYLAEAGEEFARTALWIANGPNSFNDDLLARAGANGALELDIDNLAFVYNGAGVPTGVTGIGDDSLLVSVTALATGWYAAILTNDPAEPAGITSPVDTNNLVMLTSISVGKNKGEGEVVQAIVQRREILPQLPAATITLLGPLPDFQGGRSNAREYFGTDCGGSGIPGLSVPVVGTVGSDAEASAELGIKLVDGPDYTSGSYQLGETFVDLTDTSNAILSANNYPGLSDVFKDCQRLHELVEDMREVADVICTGPTCTFPTTRYSNVIFVDGDLEINPPGGAGTLVVTGELRYNGRASWHGMVYVFGEGRFVQSGSGNGIISGALMVADIAGPDNVYGTGDDCSGGDDGFSTAVYDMSGGGNAVTQYCSQDVNANMPNPPYKIINFRQG
jgi:type IV pilus assembly PilX-like protein